MGKHSKKILLIPALFFILAALLSLGVEVYNRYYRGLSTPFLSLSIFLILLSLFFIVKKQKSYVFLTLGTVGYVLIFLSLGQATSTAPRSVVYFYQGGLFEPRQGRLHLSRPFGLYPPPSGAYLSCHFEINSWKSYLEAQPDLCSAFDEKLRLIFFLNDQKTPSGLKREIQWNFFEVGRKSLLGEPLDRGALRIRYQVLDGWFRKRYLAEEIYQAFEREINPGQNRVMETFLRDGKGLLLSLTESSLPQLSSADLFASYDGEGILTELPKIAEKGFVFPAKLDVSLVREYRLPDTIRLGEHRGIE